MSAELTAALVDRLGRAVAVLAGLRGAAAVFGYLAVIEGDVAALRRQFRLEVATLRRELWHDRLFVESDRGPLPTKFQTALLETLAYAA